MGIPVYPVVLDFDEYIRNPFFQGGMAHGGISQGSVPISRPDPVPQYDPNAPEKSLAAIRVWTTKNTIPMVRFGSLGPLTDAEALYPTRLEASVVDNILNVIRDKGLSQYVVGFAPPSSGQQNKHNLEIRLKSKSIGKFRGGKRTAVYGAQGLTQRKSLRPICSQRIPALALGCAIPYPTITRPALVLGLTRRERHHRCGV